MARRGAHRHGSLGIDLYRLGRVEPYPRYRPGAASSHRNHRRLIWAELRACVFFWPQLVRYRQLHRARVGSLHECHSIHFESTGRECAMPYCITLRSRTGARITGWYDGSDSRWSTDNKRQKLFAKKSDATPTCDELRILCPRSAKVINIEAVQDDPSLDLVPR